MANIFLLNKSVLESLFDQRYMTFDLCVRLEPVSKLFAQHADVFYRKVDRLDVKNFLINNKNVNWERKIQHRCPKFRQITSFEVKRKSREQDLSLAQAIIMLKHVDAKNDVIKGCAEKLNLESLICEELSFLSYCDANCLKTLELKELFECNSDELIEALQGFKNLDHLVLELRYQEDMAEIQKMINFVSNVLQVDRFSLKIFNWMRDDDFPRFLSHHCITKFVTGLSINEIVAMHMPRLLELSSLEYLHLENVTYCIDVFFKSLPNLTHL